MSRHPSPGPSVHNAQHGPSASSARRSRPVHSVGIAAGAEDVKYHAKYKDLKRKVKEIEAENDRLHFKTLQAKRSLQRMKLERAILYERLAPPSPPVDTLHPNQVPSAPPLSHLSRSYSGPHQTRDVRDRPMPMDSDPTPVEYLRQHRPPASDPNRSVTQMEPPPLVHSPHTSSIQSPRHASAHDTSRHLPPLSHLPPVGQYDNAARSHPLSQAGSPPLHHTNVNPTSHERGRSMSSRSHPSSAQNYPAVSSQQYPESLPPVQRVIHSPPPHPDRDRLPPRRIEGNEYPPPHTDLHHSRHPSQVSPRLHPSETRTSTRIHPHQHMSPGGYINREDSISHQYDMEREKGRDRERDWDRDHKGREGSGRDMHSPHVAHRRPAVSDYPDHPHHYTQGSTPRLRDEQVYYHEGNPYPSVHPSRSDSSSGSGIGVGEGPSRPDSRAQLYEQQQDRSSRPSYRLRPVNPSNNDDAEFLGHEDVRSSQTRDIPPGPPSSISATAAPIGTNAIATSGTNAIQSGGGNYLSAPPPGSISRESHPPPPPPPPPPMSERGYSPSRIDLSANRKRSRNDMEMDVDTDKEFGGIGKTREMGSRRNTPGPGYSGNPGGGGGSGMLQQQNDDRDRDRDRDRASSKRYQREHMHHRNHEASTSPLPSVMVNPPGGLQDQQQQDTRMATS
ncbi:hypothetical protein AGABI2DRAFT_181282 [Agaricus bisporus var. bisporus H97]|uniref:hypothetical protein n=1 Tax=Agaricus bisporus var. bisporus (strain H97 / ATCC MYA-4626 / FGSC 10389) TaxID=936046 RepID=UPI00029F55AB|nr:hypothetical protein AGABI2DRAFT_181282 [Agaricus bisporus var. bisporus H97]EKV42484.1 hypothetical protein AGABI2DRAFT_181282 [Agaricus bisporus var. bisporus H97]